MVGVAFKRDVDDVRHSPAIRVMELLLDDGAQNIEITDPFVEHIWVKGRDFESKPMLPRPCSLLTSSSSRPITRSMITISSSATPSW